MYTQEVQQSHFSKETGLRETEEEAISSGEKVRVLGSARRGFRSLTSGRKQTSSECQLCASPGLSTFRYILWIGELRLREINQTLPSCKALNGFLTLSNFPFAHLHKEVDDADLLGGPGMEGDYSRESTSSLAGAPL